MWSDPEIAYLEKVRIATNLDITQRMRLGGLFYVICSIGVILMSPTLHAQPYIALFVIFFVILAILRLYIYKLTISNYNGNEALIETAILTIYILTALGWSLFLLCIFMSISEIDNGTALGILCTVGFVSGGIAAVSPRIRLMYAFAMLIFIPALLGLVVFVPENASLVLLIIGISFFIFSVHNGKLQHENYWIARQQAILLEKQANDLEQARIQAENANKAKSAFLAAMSHEIRTPMNGVLGIAEILATTSLDQHQKNYLNMIFSSGRTLLRIIDDILDFAKIEANKLTLSHQLFNLRDLIHEVDRLFRARAKEKSLQFTVNFKNDLSGRLIGDPDRIKQILFNLLSNAFKFTDAGKVQLDVSCIPNSQEKKAELQLTVTDTGVGISIENQSQLFHAYSQVGSSTQHIKGTGLGLVITQNLLTLMNGKITVSSKLGQGSKFLVVIPLAYDNKPAKPLPTYNPGTIKPHTSSARPIRVLVVEDNAVNQIVSKTMLERFNCEVVLANNGAEAIETFTKLHFDLILMDCNMPVMDGFEATKQIRLLEQKNHTAPTPIVAVTAHAFDHIKRECLATGMNDHLSKPFDMAQLGNLLQQLSLLTKNTE
ncbi:MAG: response regulator [Burkholderiales bacterium]|uniref:response regulator n=1 Tax=Nitrosomonas sp. TaxID=42353 RepID=UPI001DB00827|nr:response regulator [Nitrosomonas sp.]MCB1948003.1 response regulator [Nitrosomonas sp.]MCP5243866.1 response regulator [Burkholderiales bacterium]